MVQRNRYSKHKIDGMVLIMFVLTLCMSYTLENRIKRETKWKTLLLKVQNCGIKCLSSHACFPYINIHLEKIADYSRKT